MISGFAPLLSNGPILLAGWRETPLHGIGYLVGSLFTLIIISSTAQKLAPTFSRGLLGSSAITLLGFGLYELYLGIAG